MKILLIEDNPTIANQVLEFLSGHRWHVDYAHNGELGIELALTQIFDVILLDLNLPDIDGLKVCKEIKQNAEVTPPILMVTARDRFEDKSAGFHRGADDYLTKPFDLRELVLRCEALKRRGDLHQSRILEIGELVLNLTTKTASRAGEELVLTNVGFELLCVLAQHYPKPVSRSFISHKLWSDTPPDSDALKSHIYSLRRALDKPFEYPMLKTVMNLGYQLEVKP